MDSRSPTDGAGGKNPMNRKVLGNAFSSQAG
jgi:hypothetical protein